MKWILVQTTPMREHVAEKNLTEHGVITFLPLTSQRRAGGKGLHCPLFPGYIFSQFDPDLTHIVRLSDKLAHPVFFGDRPAVVDEEIIADIHQRMDGGFIDLSIHWQPGDKLLVTSGRFAGMEGMFQREANGRIYAMLGTVRASFDARQVGRV